MAAGVRVSGLRQTIRSLEKFGVNVQDLKAAFQKIGNLVVSDAKALAPHKTGRLQSTIKASKTKNKSIIRAGSARVPYAGVQHYGMYNNIEPHPYLTGAIAKNKDSAVRILDSELNKLIRSLGLNP